MKLFWLGLTVLLACSSAVEAMPLRHLFLDPASVRDAEGVALHVNPPQRREIVIRPDKPWEQLMISFYLTVLDEDGKLRMWYICRDKQNRPNVAYAESRDGVRWTKPNLGIVDYDGSKENNLTGLTTFEGVVFRDPNAPVRERYAYLTHLWTEGMVRFHSPDGLHWQRDKTPLLRLGADTQNLTFWDERLGKYVLYLRAWNRADNKKLYRKVVRTEVTSLTTPMDVGPSRKSLYLWGKEKVPVIGDEFPTVFAADEKDPPDSDVYTISAQPYPLDLRWYVGFPSMFQREGRTSEGRLEVHFAGSRDGITWYRYDRKPYAPLGLAGSECANMTFMGPGLVIRGDEIWQYGTGFHSKHGDMEARKRKTDGVIYRYVQRVDGFVSLDFDAAGGRCVTAPVKVDGTHLLLNVDTTVLGQLRVGLLDAEGKPINGFSTDDCKLIRTNSTRAEVSWTSGGDLATLKGREVRLSFTGSRAKLYSFRFE
ncbi:MAG: hypothetical protein HZC54_09250 [Verrucomicrobia bacterium]|nr:hypothetical protein [Verrucomicrobiota bacterium]